MTHHPDGVPDVLGPGEPPCQPHPDATQEPDLGAWTIIATERGPWDQPDPVQMCATDDA